MITVILRRAHAVMRLMLLVNLLALPPILRVWTSPTEIATEVVNAAIAESESRGDGTLFSVQYGECNELYEYAEKRAEKRTKEPTASDDQILERIRVDCLLRIGEDMERYGRDSVVVGFVSADGWH